MDRYPPIADHGLVGDLQTAALVSSQGVVDWFAAPRFDSPSIFAALLDHDKGGYFRLAPDTPDGSRKQLYYPDTAVLVTRFMSPDGVGEVLDCMDPAGSETVTDRHTLVRAIRAVRGTVRFTLECRPRFDYGRATHDLDPTPDGVLFRTLGTTAYLQATFPVERDANDAVGVVTLHAGETAAVAFTVCGPVGPPPPPMSVTQEEERLWGIVDFWQRWVRGSRYRGRWPDMVNRSAITLKLLTYAPTGAPVAAATMGLPEQVGGERNWDYRYTWVRDGSLSIRALLDLGFAEEATAFAHWLRNRLLAEREQGFKEALRIMYRVDGEPILTEEILEHFEGYRGSYPVRVGNAAADQLQLDIYGEALYGLSEGEAVGMQADYQGWKAVADGLDWLCDSWDRPDEGIWETRGGRKDFTYSRVMCWAAFDRGLRMAAELRRPADTVRWTGARDAILEQVMARGWSDTDKAFVQHYGQGAPLDASLLLMPRVGFVSPRDPTWLSTLDAMDRTLVSDSLVYRYDPAASPDGLRGSEGTFSLCTFLYVDALARAGRLRPARYTFEKMQTYANHVGLFAEEVGPSGEQLGNFPQAFTHLSLIIAATTLDEALDAMRE
jgi:GH15 family glucan-1,4-alpha-glucosidase